MIDDKCTECGGQLVLDSYRAELFCDRCNLVAAESLILPGFEKPREEAERYPDGLILPQLEFSNRDSKGNFVKQRVVSRLRRTAQYQNIKSKERSAITFETRIRRIASQRGIPTSIVQRAVYLSRKARQTKAVKKVSLQDFALALLLAACRESRYIVTIDDLVNEDNKDLASNVRRYFNLLKKVLGLKIPPPDAQNYVTYYAGKFGFGVQVSGRAILVAKRDPNINSTPHCVAAGALYIAAKELGYALSQKAFCEKTKISEITLRNWVSLLGGYQPSMAVLPEPKAEDLETVPVEESRPYREESANDSTPEPPAPEESVRDDDDADDDHGNRSQRNRRESLRDKRNVRLRRPVKDASKTHKQAANRDHAPVKHRSSSPRRPNRRPQPSRPSRKGRLRRQRRPQRRTEKPSGR